MAIGTWVFTFLLAFSASFGNAEQKSPPLEPADEASAQNLRRENRPLLREAFQRQFSKDQLALFQEPPTLKQLSELMSEEQRKNARARLLDLETTATNPSDLEQIAEGYLLLSASEDSVRVANRLREDNSENSRAYHLTAEAQYKLGNYPAASEAAQAALKINPEDKVALAHWMLNKDRTAAPTLKSSAIPDIGERVKEPAQGNGGLGNRPAVAARSAFANLPSPPSPVDTEPIPKDATLAAIAKVAFTAAATATGGLLLFGGLGGQALEEKFPNIRRNMGIAAGIGGAFAVAAISLPAVAPALFVVPSAVPVAGTAISASRTPQGQRLGTRFIQGLQQFGQSTPQAIAIRATASGWTGLDKEAARQSVAKMSLAPEQAAAALRAISRATTTSRVQLLYKGTGDLIVRIVRPGHDGYQAIENTITPNGSKKVVQIAYDAAGKVVHYDPKKL